MAIKDVNGGLSWDHWDDGLRKRDRKALEKFQTQNKTLIESHMFKQFLFFVV